MIRKVISAVHCHLCSYCTWIVPIQQSRDFKEYDTFTWFGDISNDKLHNNNLQQQQQHDTLKQYHSITKFSTLICSGSN